MQITEEKILSEDMNLTDTLEVQGALIFDPEKSVTLTTTKNIIVTGKLVMKPARPDIVHTIRFIDVNEDRYQGGGMEVLDSDVGLWVMGNGVLDIQGSEKTAWTRATGGILSGALGAELIEVKGWNAGDEVMLPPTGNGANNYDVRTITTVSGNDVLFTKVGAHPRYEHKGRVFDPEVANLTRNVRIEGTAIGHAHIFIHSHVPQNIRYVAIRYMGPRKNQLSDSAKELVMGRYGLHFHHAGDGSRGSIVERVVIRDTGNHSFWSHLSHGVEFKDCIAYDVTEDPYGWDYGDPTDDNSVIGCMAAKLKYVPRAIDMNLFAIDKSDKVPSFGVNGMLLGRGDGNIWKDNVVIGQVGDPHTYGAYKWPTRDEDHPEGVHVFENNIAHNCDNGIQVWQNTPLQHVIVGFVSYSNRQDLHLGAYGNSYEFRNCLFTSLVEIAAGSGDRQKFLTSQFNQVNMIHSALPSNRPMLFLGCDWNLLTDNVSEFKHDADVVNCTGAIKMNSPIDTIRVQPASGQPCRLTRSGKTNISPFAPKVWGEGTGLIGEYFTDADFQNKAFERLDINISFGDWGNWIHYATPGPRMSARWGRDGGKILAQFSEAYTFTVGGGGSMRLVIDGKEVIPFGKSSGKINLEAGKLYDILVEFRNNDTNVRGGANLRWNSPSLNLFSPGGEYVPSYCLYPGETTPPPPPPPNEKPSADAGPDFEITLPVDNAVLRGSGNDDDGTIVAYNWQKIEGGQASILNPGAAVTAVNGLQEGTYRFRLTVADNQGATASDDCEVIVKPAPVINQPPSADAGPDETHKLAIALSGNATDIDGEVVKTLWEQVSGPEVQINNPDNYEANFVPVEPGEYIFRFTATDDKGASVSDEKTVTVN